MEILRNDYNQDILHAHTHKKKKDLEFLFFYYLLFSHCTARFRISEAISILLVKSNAFPLFKKQLA